MGARLVSLPLDPDSDGIATHSFTRSVGDHSRRRTIVILISIHFPSPGSGKREGVSWWTRVTASHPPNQPAAIKHAPPPNSFPLISTSLPYSLTRLALYLCSLAN